MFSVGVPKGVIGGARNGCLLTSDYVRVIISLVLNCLSFSMHYGRRLETQRGGWWRIKKIAMTLGEYTEEVRINPALERYIKLPLELEHEYKMLSSLPRILTVSKSTLNG